MTTTASTTPRSGYRPTTVEPGGIEAIPPERRHGSPWQLLSTWSAPNFEFATVFVGMIAVAYFGLDFPQAIAAIVLGTLLGGITQGVLSTWGPREGLAQLVLDRTAFGLRGNAVPAALQTVMAGLGWFATNSVSGTLALNALTGMPPVIALLIIVVIEVAVAFVGHDLVQVFERYASIVLGVIFLIATISMLVKANLSAPVDSKVPLFAGFTLTVSAAFGYAAGWNPYAADYTQYLPKATPRMKIALAAGLGNFVSCAVLMSGGAAAALITFGSNPTASYVHGMPPIVRDLTLVAIAVGAVAANALNIYSGSMAFLAAGVKIPFALRRALIALGFGVIGFFIALAAVLNGGFAALYEDFLLIIAYWIAPWLGVVFADRWLRRGTSISAFIPASARYRNPAGLLSFLIAMVVSIWLFSNQTLLLGIIPAAVPAIGDLTPEVGFLLAAVLYFVCFAVFKPEVGGPLSAEPDVVVGVDAGDAQQ